jgi:hypothetical protein
VSIVDLQTADSSEVLSIARFSCNKKDPLKDCTTLLSAFSQDEQKSFKNKQGKLFYNIPETKTRIMIQEEKNIGYYIYPKSEEIFNVFMEIISFFDEQSLKEAAKQQLAECQNASGSLANLEQALVSYPNSRKATVQLEGKSEEGRMGKCIFDIKIDSILEAKLVKPWEEITEFSKIKPTKLDEISNIITSQTGSTNTTGMIDNLALKTNTGDKKIFAQSGTTLSIA